MLARNLFKAGESLYSSSQIKDFIKPYVSKGHSFIKENVKKEDFKGFGKTILNQSRTIARSPKAAGMFYGGAIGGISGAMSSDRDTGFWQGAMMGAVGGRSAVVHGVSKNAAIGAGIGAASSFVTGESLIGSAFTGAVVGAGGIKYGRGMKDTYQKIHAARKAAAARKGGEEPGKLVSFGGAARATSNAIKKDVGQLWRGRSTRRSKNSSRMNSNQSR